MENEDTLLKIGRRYKKDIKKITERRSRSMPTSLSSPLVKDKRKRQARVSVLVSLALIRSEQARDGWGRLDQ